MSGNVRRGFTLIELLVVIAIIFVKSRIDGLTWRPFGTLLTGFKAAADKSRIDGLTWRAFGTVAGGEVISGDAY